MAKANFDSARIQTSNRQRLDGNAKQVFTDSFRLEDKNQSDSHQNRLNSQKIQSFQCCFCQMIHSSSLALSDHLMSCGNKTDQCPQCGKFIRRAIFAYHYENGCANLEETDVSSPRSRNISAASHSNSNPRRSELRKNNGDDDCDQENFRRSSKSKHHQSQDMICIPCDICNQPIDSSNWTSHSKECREKEARRIAMLAEKINQQPFTEKFPCEYCEELLLVKDLQIHQLYCLKNPAHQFQTVRIVDQRPVSTPALTNELRNKSSRNLTSLPTYSSSQSTSVPAYNESINVNNIHDSVRDPKNDSVSNNRRILSAVLINSHGIVDDTAPYNSGRLSLTLNEQSLTSKKSRRNSLDVNLGSSTVEIPVHRTRDGSATRSHFSHTYSLANKKNHAMPLDHRSESTRPLPKIEQLENVELSYIRSTSRSSIDSRGSYRRNAGKTNHQLETNKNVIFHSPRSQDQNYQPKLNQNDRKPTNNKTSKNRMTLMQPPMKFK